MNRASKIPWGELIIPLIAVIYAIYTVGMQVSLHYHDNTIKYSLYLAIPIVVFAGITIIQTLKNAGISPGENTDTGVAGEGIKRVLLSLAWVVLFIVSLGALGYLLGFFLYLVVYLWYMGVRSIPKVLMISIPVLLFIHFVFVQWMGLPFPKGIFGGIF